MTTKMAPYKRVRPATVTIKMRDGGVIKETINIGFDQRVSDLFANPSKTFVPVFDTLCTGGSVVIVNKAHVVKVEPEHEADEFVERQ